jgi:hypothetical protein
MLIRAATGSTCSNARQWGSRLVFRPTVLADLSLGQGGIIAEPALAGVRVFVATLDGHVMMLASSGKLTRPRSLDGSVLTISPQHPRGTSKL